MNSEQAIAALERRLGAFEEREAILDAIDRYCLAVDLRQDETFLGNLTEDCEIDLGDSEQEKWQGQAGVQRFLAEVVGPKKSPHQFRGLHLSGRLHIEVQGETASAEGYSFVIGLQKGALAVTAAGFNHWDLRKGKNAWQVQRRRRRGLGTTDALAIMPGIAADLACL